MGREPTIRVVTAFFAALTGFGLKHILDLKAGESLHEYQVPCFLIATLLFLRFLTGSANHLWVEHVQPADSKDLFFALDIIFLLIFGIFASFISYSSDVAEFLRLSGILLLVSIVWSVVSAVIARCVDSNSVGRWWPWLIMNSFGLLVFSVASCYAPEANGQSDYIIQMWGVFGVSAFLFLADFNLQLENIRKVGKELKDLQEGKDAKIEELIAEVKKIQR